MWVALQSEGISQFSPSKPRQHGFLFMCNKKEHTEEAQHAKRGSTEYGFIIILVKQYKLKVNPRFLFLDPSVKVNLVADILLDTTLLEHPL